MSHRVQTLQTAPKSPCNPTLPWRRLIVRSLVALVAIGALSGCGNYYFGRPVRSDEVADLVKDLGDQEELYDHLFLPLIYTKDVSFQRNSSDLPRGYTMTDRRFYGPLRWFSSVQVDHYDDRLLRFEHRERRAILLRLWDQELIGVRSDLGDRYEKRTRYLHGWLQFDPEVLYVPPPDKVSDRR